MNPTVALLALAVAAACDTLPSPADPLGPGGLDAKPAVPGAPLGTTPLIEPFDERLIPITEPLANPGGAGDAFGGAVAVLDDVDGDGAADLAVASPRADRVHVFSGKTAVRLYSFGDPDGEGGHFFGTDLAAVGDVNGDGVDDLAVGAMSDPGGLPVPEQGCIPTPNRSCEGETPNPTVGRTFLFSGADGTFIRYLRPGPNVFTFGMRVAAPGDVDGDGVPDVAVSAPLVPTGFPGYGQVFLFSGADGDRLWSRRDPPACTSVPSRSCGDDFASYGIGLGAVSDLDGDGVRDLLVGDPANALYDDGHSGFRDQRQGARTTALSGATGSVLRVHELAETETGYGRAVAATGPPVDGVAGDYVIGILARGALDLIHGASGERVRRIESPGDASSDLFASGLAPGDDFDGDGRADFWVSAAGSGTVRLVNPFGTVLLSISGFGTGFPIPLTSTLQLASTPNLGFDARRDLLVGDGAEDTAFLVRVETPRSLLLEEIARIGALAGQDILNAGQAASLGSKIRASLRGTENGNPRQATRPLGAFENEVTAYERAAVLTADQARWLIEPADLLREWIRDSL